MGQKLQQPWYPHFRKGFIPRRNVRPPTNCRIRLRELATLIGPEYIRKCVRILKSLEVAAQPGR